MHKTQRKLNQTLNTQKTQSDTKYTQNSNKHWVHRKLKQTLNTEKTQANIKYIEN